MWNYDIDTAKKLGLVTMQRSGEYIINADLTPVISKEQKKSITEIYEAFGDGDFSTDMYIATLNYTPSHTYAELKNLTLIRVLEQKTTGSGRQYQLRVNPRENPEYFDMVA